MRAKFYAVVLAILYAQEVEGVNLMAGKKKRKGFSGFLKAAGGIGSAFGVPEMDKLETATDVVGGFEDAAAGDTSVMASLTNATSGITEAAGVDPSI